MNYGKQTTISKKNSHLSFAVRYKFFFLLILTVALMFDVITRPSSLKLLDNQPFPKMHNGE